MGFGAGVFPWPWGNPGLTNEPEAFAPLSSSRALAFTPGRRGLRYVTRADGGFEAMDDIAQRVLLLTAFGVPDQKIITPQENNAFLANVRASLKILTDGPEPSIQIVELEAIDGGGGTMDKKLTFKNLKTQTKQTVHPDGRIEILPKDR